MNSDKDIPLLSSIYKSKHTGRASASTRKKGSITVEAAMAVPIFFFATLALVLLLELLSVQTAVRSGLQEAGKKLAVQAVEAPAVIPSNLERDVVNSIGAERLREKHCRRWQLRNQLQSILFVAVYGNWRNSGILSGADSGSGLFYSADFL